MPTPVYDALVVEHGWSLDDLREPFDVDAFIAESYAITRATALVRVHDVLQQAVTKQKRDARGRFTR
jgi:hypothetical protein